MLVELNKSQFNARVKRIYDGWNEANDDEDYESIRDNDALFVLAGDPAGEDEPMRKGTSFQQWLLGYEFPATLILFEKQRISILCSSTKAKILSQVEGTQGTVPVEIFAQAKAKEPANDALPKFFERYASLRSIGTFTKEQHSGKLVKEWERLLSESAAKPQTSDMAPAVSAFMAVKDEDELKIMESAAALTSTLLKHSIAPRLETILDRETKITHEVFSAQIEGRLGSGEGDNAKGPDMKVWDKGKGLGKIDWDLVELTYPPIIISKTSGAYDLRYTAVPTSHNIAHKGVFLVSVGMRYKSYASNVGRTFIVDPNKDQEAQYNLLLELQAEMLSFIKPGVVARDVFQHAIDFVKDKSPQLEKNFVKNLGFGTGVEFRDSVYLLNSKNTHTLKENMVFNLILGFTDLVDGNGAKYSLQLTDTIKIGAAKSIPLTDGVKQTKDTLFFLNADSDDEKPKKQEKKAPIQPKARSSPQKKTVAGKVLRNGGRRATQDEVHQTAAARLAEHQRELHEKIQAQGLAKFSEKGGKADGSEGKGWKKFQSYKGEGALPTEAEKLKIMVDRKAQTVILPIHGFAVPFHINTIKNASKNDEGEYTYIRINFQTPGQLAGKKEDTPFEDPEATFVRSISYRSTDNNRFDSIYKQITELKKDANKREQQKKEMADVVEQDSLVELKGRRPHKLPEAFIRPALDGKRLPGAVEIHQNGIRYQSPLGSQKVDILFGNIKHLFFQPCDHELLVIVHLNLKVPIMIGKKKTFDVQFFREASEMQFDETGNRKRKHRYGDEDELEMEHQERKRRQMLNKEIKAFAEKIAEAASTSLGETLELDVPFRELSFEGVPHRMAVRLQPTTDCLIHLSDPPFLVVTLADVEIASLERVQYSLRQFDLVLIFKDFTKPPLHINSIASSQMDDVKNWLDSVEIPMAEGPVNLNWGPIMKHINESPYDFFQGGGWTFLSGTAGDSDNSESEGSESDFKAESDVFEESESDDESDFSDASGSDDSGSDFGEGSEDDSGDDWDELERKAAKSDLKRVEGGRDSDQESDRPKKKSGSGKTNGQTKGKPTKGKR